MLGTGKRKEAKLVRQKGRESVNKVGTVLTIGHGYVDVPILFSITDLCGLMH